MTSIIPYKDLLESYEKFKSSLPEDAFTRYSQELLHVRNLISAAKAEGFNNEIEKFREIEQEALKQLQNMGFKIR